MSYPTWTNPMVSLSGRYNVAGRYLQVNFAIVVNRELYITSKRKLGNPGDNTVFENEMCVFQAALDCMRRKLSGCVLYLLLGTGIQDLICSLCVPSLQFGLVYKIATSIPPPHSTIF